MTTLELTEWRPGLKTVSLIKAVQKYACRSLSEAKTDVERFLGGETIVLEFLTEQSREAFRNKADELGVSVR
jgi:hypothetical protein